MSTNKKLGWLTASLSTSLVLAILSVGMIGGWFTGASVAETATVTLSIAGTASVSVTDSAVAFGSLFYNASCTQGYGRVSGTGMQPLCLLNASNRDLLPVRDWHVIQNNGTTTLKINATNDGINATYFFCATNRCPENGDVAEVTINVTSGENTVSDASCTGGLQFTDDASGILGLSSLKSQPILCNILGYQDDADTLNVSFIMQIPSDADQGTKTLTMTYTGTAN